MSFSEATMRDECFEIMDELKAARAKAKPGTTEHSNIVKDIAVVAGIVHDDSRLWNTMENDSSSRDLDERRFKKDVLRDEKEVELKMEQAKGNSKWYNMPITQTIITAGTATGICLAGMWINNLTENPLKNGVSQFMMRSLNFLKIR